jgi:hypothetical protein
MAAACRPARSEPAKSQFFLLMTMGGLPFQFCLFEIGGNLSFVQSICVVSIRE